MDIIGMGYVGFESPKQDGWRVYASEILGMQVAPIPDGADSNTLYLKTDDHAYRMAVHPGHIDKLAYIGWETTGRTAFRAAIETLKAENVPYELADEGLCMQRAVREMASFEDPAGYRHEIFYGHSKSLRSFTPGRPHAGFPSQERGFGHVVLATPVFDDRLDHFMCNVMGFEWFGGGAGVNMRLGFYRSKIYDGSHNIAYILTPGRRGIQHMGIPVKELDDVGIAYDLVQERDIPLVWTLGRHTQDPVISFYAESPSGFPIEYLVEVGHWREASETRENKLSLWGHQRKGPVTPSTVREIEPSEIARLQA